MIALTSTRLFAAAVVVPLGAVCLALVTQHVFGMQPCPWCVLQRLIFVAISLAALLGLAGQLMRLLIVKRLGAALMALLALGGIAAALWPDVFAAYASCADAAAKLLGVPYEFYSLTIFVVLAALSLVLLRRG